MTDEERARLAAHVVKVAKAVSEATAPIVAGEGVGLFFVLLPMVKEGDSIGLASSPFVASSFPPAPNEVVSGVLATVAEAMASPATQTLTSVHRVGSDKETTH